MQVRCSESCTKELIATRIRSAMSCSLRKKPSWCCRPSDDRSEGYEEEELPS